MKIAIKLNLIVFFSLIGCCFSEAQSNNQQFEIKVDSLMQLMTLQEKIGQTVMYGGHWDQTGPVVGSDNGKFIREGNMGAMLNAMSVKGTRDLQKIAVEETRLGIPLLFGYDVIHGHRTIFP
ncbi:MAG: glycoside hydrolase family 3 N-terminal domain-containing protein, partial [Algibacter sp.]